MKRIYITLIILLVCTAFVHAGNMYICVDESGNTIVTSTPQEGMKNCVFKDSYDESTASKTSDDSQKKVEEKDKPTAKPEEKSKETEAKIKNCMSCCDNKRAICYNYTANARLCDLENKNCNDTCNSEGATSSSWSDCWTQSKKQATEK